MSIDNNPTDVFRWRNLVPQSLNNCFDDDDPTTSENVNTPNYHVGNSAKTVSKILDKMNDMAEILEDISISIDAASGGAFNPNKSSQCTPRTPKTNKSLQRGGFARLIRQHIATLFGLGDGTLPNPINYEDQSQMDIDDESTDSEANQCYPYPGVPGHPDATPQTLSIMWKTMPEAGVNSFRQDLTQPCDSADNEFIFDLYCQENTWSNDKLADQEKTLWQNSRLANVSSLRICP
ncbi:hypothetical protein BY996DRAFT_6422270 [Phakopsora pachyrhizi]|nr:hypothetical protein BY996DRAFT_6422270 [Phakopsora pachyrhizi]